VVVVVASSSMSHPAVMAFPTDVTVMCPPLTTTNPLPVPVVSEPSTLIPLLSSSVVVPVAVIVKSPSSKMNAFTERTASLALTATLSVPPRTLM